MRAIVLAYHSHNVFGDDYASNDHVALAHDLETITSIGAVITPLHDIAYHWMDQSPSKIVMVGLSFDDGPVFDFHDFRHRQFGPQRSFFNIMLDFSKRRGSECQPRLHATSFVIASPGARSAMARSEECGYAWMGDWLSDAWWKPASESGLIEIANHSWDHVHSTVPDVCASVATRNDFSQISTFAAADCEIRAAGEYIRGKTGTECRLFAYPFGHTNDYLVHDYFPKHGSEHGMIAAFGTGPGGQDRRTQWNIPRLVCGHDWKSSDQLAELIMRAE